MTYNFDLVKFKFNIFHVLMFFLFLLQVSLAKPPSDKKKKEEILRARERRMMQMMQGRPGGLVG